MHPLLRSLAERQWGVFTASDARRAGYEHPEIRRLLSSGRWATLRRGVYVTTEELTAQEALGRRHALDCLAVLLTLGRPSTAISATSAARLWGWPWRRGLDGTVRLTDPELWRRGKGFRVTPAALPPADVTTVGPLRLTAPARTLVDCAREWALEDAVVAMDAALLAGQTSPGELLRAATAARGWPGAARAARAVRLADGRAESVLETRGRLRIVGAGLPAPDLQVEIRTGGRLLGVADAWFEQAAVAVEFDGRVKYADPWRGRSPERVLWEEKRREDAMRALGIRFLRVAHADLARWPVVEDRLRHLLAEGGPSPRLFSATPRQRGVRRTA